MYNALVFDIRSVGCIIVTFNSFRVIDGCLTSLLNSGVEPSQIYVVDNNSADETVSHISQNYPGINVTRSFENLGFSRANNLGVEESSSELIVFANPDVLFLPGAVRELIGELDSKRTTGICGPLIVDRSFNPKPESYMLPVSVLGTFLLQSGLWKPLYYARRLVDQVARSGRPRKRAALSGACLAVRREDFLQVGGFDEDFFMYAEDVDLCERVSRAGLRVVQLPTAKIVHIGGGTYTGSRTVFFNSLRTLDALFLKNSGPGALVAKRLLVVLGLFLRWMAFRLLQQMGSKKYRELPSRLREGLRPFLSFKLLTRVPLSFPPS